MERVESFFLIGCQVNEIELKEVLLRRYGRYKFPDMKFDEYIEFVVLALTKERQDEIRGMYHALLPVLALRGKFMTFEQFFDKMTGADIDMRPAEDILKESEEIQARLQNGNRTI